MIQFDDVFFSQAKNPVISLSSRSEDESEEHFAREVGFFQQKPPFFCRRRMGQPFTLLKTNMDTQSDDLER